MEMRAIYANCLAEMMEKDKRVVVLDADLSKASGTRALYERFPEQIFECGIAEQDMTSIAAGLASYGFKPWIESFATFASRRNCDQITLSVAYAKQNVKIVGTDPGIAAELNGGTHMALEDIGVLRSIPTLVITEPPKIFDDDYKFDLFKADVLKEGKDLTICVSGFQTKDVLDAEKALAADGIDAEIVNVHTIKPIDAETICASARKTGAVLTVENHNVIGGLRSAVLEALAEEKIPVCAVGVQDRFGEVGKLPYLREAMGLTVENIIETAKRAVTLK